MWNGWYGLLWSLRLKMASGFSRISRAFSVFLKPMVNCYRVEYFISFQLAMTSLSSVTSVLARISYKPFRDVKLCLLRRILGLILWKRCFVRQGKCANGPLVVCLVLLGMKRASDERRDWGCIWGEARTSSAKDKIWISCILLSVVVLY